MLFNNNNKRKEEDYFFETEHRLIVYNMDQLTTDIYNVTAVDDEKVIAAGRAAVPKADCTVTVSEYGRVYTYQAPNHIIEETERLAKLEQSMVLHQLTNFKAPKEDNPNLDLMKWALIGLLFVAIIVAAF